MASSDLPDVLGGGIHASRPAATDVVAGATYSCTTHGLEYQSDGATWSTRSTFGAAASGSITASGYTQSTGRLLGRTTASTGAIEEITVGTGLSLSAGSLTATGGGGALVLLEQHTASASASLDFTTFISATYDEYLFEIVDLHLASDNVNLLMRMGTGGGPTFDTGANYAWSTHRWAHNGAAVAGSTGTTSFGLDGSGGIDNGANYGVGGHFRLFNPQSATYKRVEGQLSYTDNALSPIGCVFGGAYLSTTAVTGVQFLASSGNIASGVIRVYGVAK